MIKIAILASGSGSNALALIEYFRERKDVEINFVISNKRKSGVITHAAVNDIDHYIIDKEIFYESSLIDIKMKSRKIDLIVLAGFLWKIPDNLLKTFAGRIINIHPSLLPKHGGLGMYGLHVHRSVLDSKDEHSGISIHLVNENYDEGEIIFQKKCDVLITDTPESLADRVLVLEHENLPKQIDKFIKQEIVKQKTV
ncbi:MAG: phosphoribosylglycinamide formyltransferase [Flavobacteriales bacterium]|nr:phosphoribosylglycinamide formyltransferase [Flavobacteriales bacterium]